MPLVAPLPPALPRAALFGFLNRWNDAMATELEAPAAADGQRWLAAQGWSAGKHAASGPSEAR